MFFIDTIIFIVIFVYVHKYSVCINAIKHMKGNLFDVSGKVMVMTGACGILGGLVALYESKKENKNGEEAAK